MKDIPTDIIFEIFQFYTHFQPPQRLLTVCKQFYNIVINSGSLWSRILLCDEYSKALYRNERNLGPKQDLDNKVQCRSIRALLQAFERARNSTIELTIILEYNEGDIYDDGDSGFHWDLLDGHSWPERCRSLSLVYARAPNILKDSVPDFPILERLEVSDAGTRFHRSVKKLLLQVKLTSPRLYHLHLYTPPHPYEWCAPGPDYVFDSYLEYIPGVSSLIPRMQILYLSSFFRQHIEEAIQYATSVTTLGIYMSSNTGMQTLVKCPSPLLETLIMRRYPCGYISTDIYSKLVRLTIEADDFTEKAIRVELPRLTHLSIIRWWPLIINFHAPKLYSLELLGRPPISYEDLKDFQGMTLCPLKVDVDVQVEEADMRKLLEALWNKVEDLQLVYGEMNRALGETMVSAFGGTETGCLCPKLERLVIISKKSQPAPQAESEELLRNVARRRRNGQRFKKVKYGWYELEEEDGDPRLGNIEWVDITDS